MDGLLTSFDKTRMNECTDRCIAHVNTMTFTPAELSCFNRYLFLDSDAPEMFPSFNLLQAGPGLTQRNSTSDSPLSENDHSPLIFILSGCTPRPCPAALLPVSAPTSARFSPSLQGGNHLEVVLESF